MPRNVVSNLLGFLGAIVGGVIGYLGYRFALRYGLYAMILPGGLLGLGCGALAMHRSVWRGVACLVAGLALGLFAEWKSFWVNKTLGEFLAAIPGFDPMTMIMIGVGGLLAFWCGRDDWGVLYRSMRRSPGSDG
jgi:hypothetical protein